MTDDQHGEDVTRVTPGGEDDTRVMPGEDATSVEPGGEAQTRVLATPPPVGPKGRTSAAEPGGDRRRWRPPRLVWFALLGIALGMLLTIVVGLFLRGPDIDPFLGTWGPAEGSAGPLGGLVIEAGAEVASVTLYSAPTEAVGAAEAAWDGNDLKVTVPGGGALMDADGPAKLRIVYDEDDDELVATFETAAGGGAQRLARVSALAPGPGQTAPAPAPTLTPTPTPPVTESPSANASPSTSPDDEVRSALTRIQVGVLTWSSEHGGLFPPASEVTADGEVGPYVDPWPVNPFTGAPMRTGSAEGDYAYEQLDAGRSYRLTGFLSDGATVVVP